MIETKDLLRKIKLARKYIQDREYQEAYNTLYLPPEYESNLVEARVIQHTENFNNWLDKYFISDGIHYCYKTRSGHKLFTLKELYKKFEQAYHEKPSVSA